ncbi:MAG: phosphotransferase [Armatimonas sp.]
MDEILTRAAQLLGEDSLTLIDGLRTEGRNRVARARRASNGDVVIIKASVGEDGLPTADPSDDDESTGWRMRNEGAGLAFLSQLDITPPIAPRFLAGNFESGIVVMEDLGAEAGALSHRLLGSAPDAANEALLSYARALARMHSATQGHEEQYQAVRASWGGQGVPEEKEGDTAEKFCTLLEKYGVAVSDALKEEQKALSELLRDRTWYAFTPRDCCPDNNLIRDDGTVVFFDLEFAVYRHALLDLAYLTAPFPTCWCVGRLEIEQVNTAIAAYRAVFNPAPGDFDKALAAATGFWMMGTMAWNWGDWEKEDQTWGEATIRQRHLLRLENGARLLAPYFPILAEAATQLRETLAPKWPDLEPLPAYRVFRQETANA